PLGACREPSSWPVRLAGTPRFRYRVGLARSSNVSPPRRWQYRGLKIAEGVPRCMAAGSPDGSVAGPGVWRNRPPRERLALVLGPLAVVDVDVFRRGQFGRLGRAGLVADETGVAASIEEQRLPLRVVHAQADHPPHDDDVIAAVQDLRHAATNPGK